MAWLRKLLTSCYCTFVSLPHDSNYLSQIDFSSGFYHPSSWAAQIPFLSTNLMGTDFGGLGCWKICQRMFFLPSQGLSVHFAGYTFQGVSAWVQHLQLSIVVIKESGMCQSAPQSQTIPMKNMDEREIFKTWRTASSYENWILYWPQSATRSIC